MAAWKLAPALAAGNTVVLKPAETTPLTAMLLAEVLQEVELPPGVVNIVNGAGETGAALVDHPGVDKIAFTGSTEVGRRIMRATAGTGKKLTLELGGKGANIVFADAALDQAVEGTINGIFFNQGHVCCAGSRLLLEESVAEDFLERLKRRIQTLRVGDPLDKNTDMGAINSAAQLATIQRLVDTGVGEGATVWQGCATEPPYHRLLLQAHAAHGRPADGHRGARGDLRTGALGAHLPHPRGGGDQGERHRVRPLRRRVEREDQQALRDRPPAARRRGLGQRLQPVRSGLALRRRAALRLRPRGRPARAVALPGRRVLSRLRVVKTLKLYVGGQFVRSESGRTISAQSHRGESMQVSRASRKDLRDTVELMRAAQPGWWKRSAYNRGQILYRLAEMLEDRSAVLPTTAEDVAAAVDRAVHHAGWTDKITALLSSLNPVATTYVNYSMLAPSGVVLAVPHAEDGLLGLVEATCASLVMGNAVVLVVPAERAELATAFAEALATSDVPAGMVNVLTGDVAELVGAANLHDDLRLPLCRRGRARARAAEVGGDRGRAHDASGGPGPAGRRSGDPAHPRPPCRGAHGVDVGLITRLVKCPGPTCQTAFLPGGSGAGPFFIP